MLWVPVVNRFSLRPKYTDRRRGEPLFDWDVLTPRVEEEGSRGHMVRPRLDKLDLLLLRELEVDAAMNFTDMSLLLVRKYGVIRSDRLLLYHYSNHLLGRGLISKYLMTQPREACTCVCLMAHTNQNTFTQYREYVLRIPYLSRELTDGLGHHYTEHHVPLGDYVCFMGYIRSNLAPLTRKIKMYACLPDSSRTYPLPVGLFNDENSDRTHDPQADLERVLAKAKEITIPNSTNTETHSWNHSDTYG